MKIVVSVNRFMDRAKIFALYLLPLAGTMLVGGCRIVSIGPILTNVTEPIKTSTQPRTSTKTPLPSTWLVPMATKIAQQGLTVTTPTKAVMDLPIPNLEFESPSAVEDMQKLIELYLTAEGVKDIVLAPEQVFTDFYNKVIPDISNLRFRSTVDLTERLNIGVPVYTHHEIHGDYAKVQAILMGGFINQDGGFVLLGTEDAKTGNRAIVPVQVTFGFEGLSATVGIREDHESRKTMAYSVSKLEFISAEELLVEVKGRLGRDILVNLMIDYPPNGPIAEDRRIADEKYFLFDRFKMNDLFIKDPLSIDKNNLLNTPWIGYIIF